MAHRVPDLVCHPISCDIAIRAQPAFARFCHFPLEPSLVSVSARTITGTAFMSVTAAGGQSETPTARISDPYLPARPIVRIHLFGSMRATSYLGDDVLPRAKKARAALGYLCLNPGARTSRTRLATMLWDRVSADQARTSFRQALRELTAAMGPLAAELISAGRATVRLDTDVCWIDALALMKSPYSDPTTRADLAVLCRGELLEGFNDVSESFGEWLAEERVR